MFLSDFQTMLPSYLTAGDKEAIEKELKAFPKDFSYYHLGEIKPVIAQGDGVIVPKVSFAVSPEKVEEFLNVKCVVLSNTCDISLANKRKWPPRIILAPIMSLTKFESQYHLSRDALDAIRTQRNTAFFYLPDYEGNGEKEYFIQYDRAFTIPRTVLQDDRKSILFRLTQQGFYLFLMKLSINFCRFGEGPDLHRSIKSSIAVDSGD